MATILAIDLGKYKSVAYINRGGMEPEAGSQTPENRDQTTEVTERPPTGRPAVRRRLRGSGAAVRVQGIPSTRSRVSVE